MGKTSFFSRVVGEGRSRKKYSEKAIKRREKPMKSGDLASARRDFFVGLYLFLSLRTKALNLLIILVFS